MRRLAVVVTGVLLAGVCSMAVLAVAVLADADLVRAETAIAVAGVAGLIGAALQGGGTGAHLLGLAVALAWVSVVAVCFVPVAIAAAVGEAARTESFVWYAGASGAMAAAMPTMAQAFGSLPAARMTPLEARMTLALFLTGVAAGLVYWLLAGRGAGGVAR